MDRPVFRVGYADGCYHFLQDCLLMVEDGRRDTQIYTVQRQDPLSRVDTQESQEY